MQNTSLFNIFRAFFKIGAVLLGGGYVIVPVMTQELVKNRSWLSDDEVCDYYCVCQCLPGIIAVNMSILVGYKLRKFFGAITALFAMSLSPFVSIIIIANIIKDISNIPFIDCIFYGVNISVIVLLYLAVKDIWNKSIIDRFTLFWFLLILILSIFKVSPVILILTSVVFGLLFQKFKGVLNDKN